MFKKVTAAIIAFSMIAAGLNIAYAINKGSMTSKLYLSQESYPSSVNKVVNNSDLKSSSGGPIAYGENYSNKYNASGKLFSYGYYQTPLALENDEFDTVIPYLSYGSSSYTTCNGNENRLAMLLAAPCEIKSGDGVYISFYYRSMSKFNGAGSNESNEYSGNPADINLIGFDHKRSNWNCSMQTLDGGWKLSALPDDKWHRVDILAPVTDELYSYLDDPNFMEFSLGFPNLNSSYYIEFAGFRVGVLKDSTAYEYNRLITELGWHLTNNKIDSVYVGSQEIFLKDMQQKYVVKDTGERNITANSNSGAYIETFSKGENEIGISIRAGIYDRLRADDDVITCRQRVNSAGEIDDGAGWTSYSVKNSDMKSDGYSVVFSENIFDSPLRTIPDSEIFSGSPTYTKAQYQEWVDNGLPENMVEQVLCGNIAFVTGSDNYWLFNQKIKTSESAAVEIDGELYILSSICKNIFGNSSDGKYTKPCDIKSDYELFTDPRGFILFSKSMAQSINKAPVKENDIGYRHYTSYYAVQLAIAEISWDDITPTEADYQAYIANWQNRVIMPEDKMSDYDGYITTLCNNVSGYMSNIDTSNADFFTDGCSTYEKYARIYEMAKCYKTLVVSERNDINTDTLKNNVLALLEHLYTTDFSQNQMLRPVDNWFNSLITYPTRIGDTLMLMRDEVSTDNMTKYINTWNIILGDACVSKFVVPYEYDTNNPSNDVTNPCSNYTNLLWRSHAILRFAVLGRSDARVNRTLKYMNGVFEYTENLNDSDIQMIKDGFYRDGSFVFHNYYAYNTGYGNSYAAQVAEMLTATKDTIFDIRKLHNYDNLYSFVEYNWIPFMYKGAFSKFTSGRELPQGWAALSSAIMIMLDNAPSDIKERVGIKFKSQLSTAVNKYKYISSLPGGYYSMCYPALQGYVNDFITYMETLPDEHEYYSHVYYNMDRVIHKQRDFTFMLAMSSERVDRYEAINDLGYSDWYTGDGMTYTITDGSQYISSTWWEGIDRYKIPGTTVDSTERNPLYSKYGNHNAENSYAGGVSDGQITAAGMILPGNILESDKKLVGKKSYFMLEDQVICLGSGITGGNGEVYTTIDNIRLNDAGAQIRVNGNNLPTETDTENIYTNPKYVWCRGGYAYAFLGENKVSLERVVNDKRYTGTSKTSGGNTDPFFTVLIEHGENPQNAKYGYVILPDRSNAEASAYNPDTVFEILEQSEAAHVIRLKDSGIIMANVFTSANIAGMTFKTPANLIIKPYGNGYKIYASEPNQDTNAVTATIATDKIISNAASLGDDDYKLDLSEPGATTTAEVSDYLINDTGSTYEITVLKDVQGNMIIASYDGDKLLKVYVNEKAVFDKSFDRIKTFNLEDFATIKPLSDSETLFVE